jgi:hypothetical protein
MDLQDRAAIARTIAGVRETSVEAPFLWYGLQFLKALCVTTTRVPDQIGHGLPMVPFLASALRRIMASAPIYATYMTDEVLQVLRAAFSCRPCQKALTISSKPTVPQMLHVE